MRLTFALLSATLITVSLDAQTAVQAGAPTSRTVAAVPPAQTDPYVYQTDGRRDPFLSLIGGGIDPHPNTKRAEGLGGFSLADISVRGVMQSRDALVAMVQGPDNKTYLIHQGDKLADAVVKSVTTQGLVVMQDVSDPLSVQKQREVRKMLRSLEGVK